MRFRAEVSKIFEVAKIPPTAAEVTVFSQSEVQKGCSYRDCTLGRSAAGPVLLRINKPA